MKATNTNKAIMPDNAAEFTHYTEADILLLAAPLLQLISEAMDAAISKGGYWISIGTTRKVDAIVLTVHTPDGSITCYGSTVLELLQNVPELL